MSVMRLYLVQHGEAVSKDIDPDRPLTAAGRQDIELLASFLWRHRVSVSRIIHSGKARAGDGRDPSADHSKGT
jgi:phosphohistidine phosphatase